MVSFQLQCWLFFTDERELPCTLLVVVSLKHRHHRHHHSCLQVRYTVLNIIHATFTLGVWIKEMTTLGVSADNHNGNINDDNINVDDEDIDVDHDNIDVDDEDNDDIKVWERSFLITHAEGFVIKGELQLVKKSTFYSLYSQEYYPSPMLKVI